MRKLFSVVVFIFSLFATLPANATYYVFDTSNYAQNLLNYARQAEQLLQASQQTSTQLQQLASMAQNLQSMDQGSAQQIMTGIQTNLYILKNIQTQSRGMTYNYGQLSSSFDQMYPGFASYNGGMSATDYSNRMQQWQNQTHNAMYDSMKAQGLADSDKMQSEADMLNTLIQASQTSQGALSAAQAGNQIAGFQAQQLMEQKAIMAAGYRAQASFYEQQLQQQEADRAWRQRMAQDSDIPQQPMNKSNIMNFGK